MSHEADPFGSSVPLAHNELDGVLDSLGVGREALLGEGGEAWVFALDQERVARVNRGGAESIGARNRLLAELRRSADRVPFAIPEVIETRKIEGRFVTIERRLPGRELTTVLSESVGEERASLVRSYLDAASRIGELEIERPWFGELVRDDAIRRPTFGAYLEARAAESLKAGGLDGRGIDPAELAAAWPEPSGAALVHLDAFPGNMLAEHGAITSVLDFSVVSLVGDARLDPLAAAAYLDPRITPTANDADRAEAHEWLEEHGLEPLFDAAERWLAAFWCAALDDTRLHAWCRSILGVDD